MTEYNTTTNITADHCPFGLPKPQHKSRALLVNPYMETGYRVNYTAFQCAVSIFTFHNETWNIWTHLLPVICISLSLTYLLNYELVEYSTTDQIMIGLFYVLSGVALLCSSLYHTFSCISIHTHDCLLCGDMAGCVSLLMAFTVPCTYFGFTCFPYIRNYYLIGCCIMFGLGIYICIYSNHKTIGYKLRLIGFPLLGLNGIAILLHIYLVLPSHDWQIWIPYQYTFICSLIGLVAYLSRFPEKYFKHFVETTHFYSHAIWHLCIDATILIGCVQILRVSKAAQDYVCEYK